MKLAGKILLGAYSSVLILAMIMSFQVFYNKPEYAFFWATLLFSMVILIISVVASKMLSENTDRKIDEVLRRVKLIEERLDGLHKK